MNEEQRQTCSNCNVEKSVDEFYFRKDTNNYRTKCKNCWIEKQSNYYTNNKDKIIEQHNDYERRKRKIDQKYKLIKNTRSRIFNALKGDSKSKSTKEILGIDVETYKKWIEFQMTEGMNWNNIHIDHVKPISSFDFSNDDELLEAFNWRNTQPLFKRDNLSKGNKFNELDYRLQFIKAYEFINSNK